MLSSVIPYSLELEALRRIAVGTFGVLMSLEPAVAALIGLVALGQGLATVDVIGIGAGRRRQRGRARLLGRRGADRGVSALDDSPEQVQRDQREDDDDQDGDDGHVAPSFRFGEPLANIRFASSRLPALQLPNRNGL